MPSFHPGFELMRPIGPSEALDQCPGTDVRPAEGPRQVPSGQPDAVPGVHVEVFVVSSGVDHGMSDCEVAHVPDDVARVPDSPGELDSLVGIPEGSGPAAALVEGPSLQTHSALPHGEHVRRMIGRPFLQPWDPPFGRVRATGFFNSWLARPVLGFAPDALRHGKHRRGGGHTRVAAAEDTQPTGDMRDPGVAPSRNSEVLRKTQLLDLLGDAFRLPAVADTDDVEFDTLLCQK